MMKTFRVGIDSYSLSPLGLSARAVLDWAEANGAEGVQFSEGCPGGSPADDAELVDLGQSARERGMYIEWGGGQHIPFDTTKWRAKDLLGVNTEAARRAQLVGASVVRSCSGGLMRWGAAAPSTEVLLQEMARALRAQEPMWRDMGVTLAIELHFEFTTFELLRLFEMCKAEPGGPLGICLDTMNLLTMLEDPVAGTERILPWVVATHVKDGGLMMGKKGLVSFPAEAGTGVVDIEGVLARLVTLKRRVNLSLEDHGGSFTIPIYDPEFMSRFPDLEPAELTGLLGLAKGCRRRVESRELVPLDRGQWPRHCEARVLRGLQHLKQVVAAFEQSASDADRDA